MKRRIIAVAIPIAFLALSCITPKTEALSDLIGVFARVDKVIFEPNAEAPDRVQIWGAFTLASKENTGQYGPAQRGYFYYSIVPGRADVCRSEWADFKAAAGTDQIIGFGWRSSPLGHIRKADEKPSDPDLYPLVHGLTKFSGRTAADYPPVRELRSLPRETK